jgi:hypothetical protein
MSEVSGRLRWLCARSLRLHAALLGWVAGCAAAATWQVGRALEGNALSYLYSFEWPFFGVLGVVGWWMLLHSEPAAFPAAPGESSVSETVSPAAVLAPPVTSAVSEDDDPTLAAYNAHLARLAVAPKKKLWGH